jgi:hypothetical protein
LYVLSIFSETVRNTANSLFKNNTVLQILVDDATKVLPFLAYFPYFEKKIK